MRILVIDDDKAHGESLADLLNARGQEAYYAHDFAESEWLLQLFRFRVALIDHDMPGMPGPVVAARLAERDPELRTVIMSAREENRPDDDRPFVSKPIGVDDLLHLLVTLTTGTSLMVRLSFPVAPYAGGRPQPDADAPDSPEA